MHGLCAWFLCKQWQMLALSRVQRSNELVGGCFCGNSSCDSSCSHHLVPNGCRCTSWIHRRRQNLIKTPSWLSFLQLIVWNACVATRMRNTYRHSIGIYHYIYKLLYIFACIPVPKCSPMLFFEAVFSTKSSRMLRSCCKRASFG